MSSEADRPEDERSLEDLVVQALERVETEGESALAAVLRENPGHAARLRERFEKLRSTGLLALARNEDAGAFPERLGDFRLVRRLGEGGMGVVFLAEQVSLGREVALKLVRPEHLWLGGARERFRREVEAVARLAHPSIVPIHTVGEENGVPFYAMEHVAGVSLAEALASFTGREPAKLCGADLEKVLRARAPEGSSASGERRRFEGSWIECCLSIARGIAEALAHAHERGVLHRDVKPSNVMLSPSGRVLLFDFGLAALAGSEKLTRSGAQLGSLAYMAPEQVDGRAKEVGPVTDVYALGVTLHEMLTLALPYRGANAHEIAARIRAAEPEPMRRRNPAISGDVETLVLTAIDPDPARRYASAADLARDLTNVLELRPIEARRANVALRTRRWVQRHPGWAASIALGVTLVVAGPLSYALQQRSARVAIAHQRDQARANLRSALEAVDFMTRVGQDELLQIPQAEDARRRLLEGALGFYRRFAGQRADDLAFEREVAEAEARVGGIHWLLGDHARAGPALERAVAALAGLPDTRSDPRARRVLGEARMQLADTLSLAGDLDAAHAALRRTIDEVEAIEAPGDSDRIVLATAHRKLADVLKTRGDRSGAAAELRLAAALLQDLDAAARDVASSVLEAGTWARLAQQELALRDAAGAETSLARSRAALAAVPPAYADDIRVREQDAMTENQYAQLLVARGALDRAHGHAQRAVEINAGLDADFPRVARYRNQLAVTCTTLGAIEGNRGDHAAAAPHLERAAALLEDLCARFPEVDTYATQLAGVEVGSVKMLVDAGRADDALRLSARVLERLERVITDSPHDAQARGTRDVLRLERARALLVQDRDVEASQALAEIESLESPAHLVLGARIAAGCALLARSSADLEEPVRAERLARYHAQALACLRRAREKGFADLAAIEADPWLAPLLAEPGFRELAAPLEAK